MIFENIKPGDLALVPVEVRIGWKSHKYRIPQKVTRTTRTQIIVNGKRYRRDDGRAIGSGGYVDVLNGGQVWMAVRAVMSENPTCVGPLHLTDSQPALGPWL